jgi:hypothetical protein
VTHLREESRNRPVVLVLKDLQAADVFMIRFPDESPTVPKRGLGESSVKVKRPHTSHA